MKNEIEITEIVKASEVNSIKLDGEGLPIWLDEKGVFISGIEKAVFKAPEGATAEQRKALKISRLQYQIVSRKITRTELEKRIQDNEDAVKRYEEQILEVEQGVTPEKQVQKKANSTKNQIQALKEMCEANGLDFKEYLTAMMEEV
jgi:hypothetical protein